jgi:hypothetical protein
MVLSEHQDLNPLVIHDQIYRLSRHTQCTRMCLHLHRHPRDYVPHDPLHRSTAALARSRSLCHQLPLLYLLRLPSHLLLLKACPHIPQTPEVQSLIGPCEYSMDGILPPLSERWEISLNVLDETSHALSRCWVMMGSRRFLRCLLKPLMCGYDCIADSRTSALASCFSPWILMERAEDTVSH